MANNAHQRRADAIEEDRIYPGRARCMRWLCLTRWDLFTKASRRHPSGNSQSSAHWKEMGTFWITGVVHSLTRQEIQNVPL